MADPNESETAVLRNSVLIVTLSNPEDAIFAVSQAADYVRAVLLIVDSQSAAGASGASFPDLADVVREIEVPAILLATGGGSIPAELSEAFDLCFFDLRAAYVSTQGPLTAGEASERGLINRAAPLDEARSAASDTANAIASLAPLAVRAAKRAVREGSRFELREGMRLENRLFSELFGSEDMREGTAAFLEKRTPVFRGE
ncbi:MAG: hypothetical protein IPM63_07180 [Acidobacteriota bacterium]|nr:MAG: hypothetical protein IPM63_07180 [Acidobacteriota bacterium]